jgi:ubiquinone/menaquinone biosynthesis C-methylase UbiE
MWHTAGARLQALKRPAPIGTRASGARDALCRIVWGPMSSASASYIIDGGEPGAARLAVLGRTLAASSERFLRRAGLRPGVRVLDVGCGSGELTGRIAELAAPGEAVGIDVDLTVLSIARERFAQQTPAPRFALADAAAVPAELGRFDVVYARFVLSHQTDPLAMLRGLRELCLPGGVVAVEDVDIPGMFAEPRSEAFERWVELYCQAAVARGADPRIGPRLAGLFEQAGLAEIDAGLVHRSFREGEGKRLAEITLRSIRLAVLECGLIDEDGFDDILDEVRRITDDPDTLIGLPRIHQVMGRP